eukprot:3630370-Amphidinium_carterae.1
MEVERTPLRVLSCARSVLKERATTKPAKPGWQLVVGKQGRKRCCDVLSCAAGPFPLECANSFVVLERGVDNDEEEFFSAKSDDF